MFIDLILKQPKSYLLATAIFLGLTSEAQFNMHRTNIGKIVNQNGIVLGSAFIGQPQFLLITCLHVVEGMKDAELKYISISNDTFSLKIKMTIKDWDLAVFQIENKISNGQPLGNISRIQPGDKAYYVGFNISTQNFDIHEVIVSSCGITQGEQNKNIDFIEFEGNGIPGYSGGPVFDLQGMIVGYMREGWFKEGVKGGQKQLFNRAYSIEPIVLQLNSVFYN